MYMYECIYRIHVCVNVCVCVCVCARGGVVCPSVQRASVSTLVHRGVYGCPDAHTHAHRRPHLRLSAAISSCMRGMYGFTCMRVSMARHRRAGIGMHAYVYIYIYIYNYIYIPIIHLLCTDMHASCMDPLCTQVSMSVCTQTDRYRWGARVFTRHPFS